MASAEGRVRLAHRLEHALFLVLAGAVGRLPERAALAATSGLGWFVASVLRVRRRVVEENLARAFPDRDPAWRRRVAVAAYRHVGRQGALLLRLARLGPDAVRERTEIVGLEHVLEPLSRGRGVLLLTGHLGNWEIGGASLTVRGIPLDVVARRQKNPLFDAHIRRTRESLGMRVVYRDEAPRRVLRTLRAGEAVAMVADQRVREGGIVVDFFGVPAVAARGPALLALRAGARIVMAAATSLPGSPGRYRVTIRPLAHPETGSAEGDARALTRAYLAALEEMIREAPEQYFWLHRRWRGGPQREIGTQEPDGSAAV